MTRPEQEHANGWCCVDCLVLLANGETPPEMTEEQTAAWLAEIDRMTAGATVTLGRMLGEDGCKCEEWDTDQHREGCERLDFTWKHHCDVCGSTLGGAREAVTFWWNKEDKVTT
jgi:hypothetical protein